jgi:hypothetical protein
LSVRHRGELVGTDLDERRRNERTMSARRQLSGIDDNDVARLAGGRVEDSRERFANEGRLVLGADDD